MVSLPISTTPKPALRKLAYVVVSGIIPSAVSTGIPAKGSLLIISPVGI
ncbi:MAG: hypothetical protein ACXVED_11030 [Bacteroidia bacterium]